MLPLDGLCEAFIVGMRDTLLFLRSSFSGLRARHIPPNPYRKRGPNRRNRRSRPLPLARRRKKWKSCASSSAFSLGKTCSTGLPSKPIFRWSWMRPPSGTFNYSDTREYTPAEAIDLLNTVSMTKGFMLVRRDRMLMLINIEDGIPPNLVSTVPVESLDSQGRVRTGERAIRLEQNPARRYRDRSPKAARTAGIGSGLGQVAAVVGHRYGGATAGGPRLSEDASKDPRERCRPG